MLGLVSEEGSKRRRLVDVEDCEHFVHLVRPDLVAGEVRWVVVEGVGGCNLRGRI